jgi:hypothetical protein
VELPHRIEQWRLKAAYFGYIHKDNATLGSSSDEEYLILSEDAS